MGQYSIKELEQLSGIKAHTIRIWEKRHHLIEPQRTKTNIRYYSDEDLKKIINVSLLNTHGIKISRIVGMSGDEISNKIIELSQSQHDASIHIDQLIVSMVDLDEEKFEKTISGLTLRFDFEKTVTEIIYPFLEKIGVLWQTGNISPAQEHFVSNLIRQKIIVAIDALPIAPQGARRALLYLPEIEQHEIALLFYHYLTKKAGFKTFYLGQTVPHEDLKSVYETHHPEIIITSLTAANPSGTMEHYLKKMSDDFPNAKILASGYQVQHIIPAWPNVHLFKKALDLKQLF
ncbi:MAG: MerR family transcriptional regulator [Cyclobacteriaceae bacterium]|nr:MerR family transcriptional regulator [Cyclobacteriaceae bacterium]